MTASQRLRELAGKALLLSVFAAFLVLYLRREERMEEPDEYDSWRFV